MRVIFMIRKQVLITEKQSEFFKDLSERKGLSFSDLLRRVLDEYIENYNTKTNLILKEDSSTVIYEVVKKVE